MSPRGKNNSGIVARAGRPTMRAGVFDVVADGCGCGCFPTERGWAACLAAGRPGAGGGRAGRLAGMRGAGFARHGLGWRAALSGVVCPLRLCAARRTARWPGAAGGHGHLRFAQSVHAAGHCCRRYRHADVRVAGGGQLGRALFGLRAAGRGHDPGRGPSVGDVQAAGRGTFQRWLAGAGRGRAPFVRDAGGPQGASALSAVFRGRGAPGGDGRPAAALLLQAHQPRAAPDSGQGSAGVLASLGAGQGLRRHAARAPHHQRSLCGGQHGPRQAHRLQAGGRLLGRCAAGAARHLQFRAGGVQVFPRRGGTTGSLQGRRVRLAVREQCPQLDARPRGGSVPQWRDRQAQLPAFQCERHAGLCAQHAPSTLQGRAGARGVGAGLRFRLAQPSLFPGAVHAHAQLFRQQRHGGFRQTGCRGDALPEEPVVAAGSGGVR